jgi:hypothetical protein
VEQEKKVQLKSNVGGGSRGAATLPKYLDVELRYSYLDGPVTYKFPRRRAKDAAADEQERMLGEGRKLSPAQRLSRVVEDITGWEAYGFEPRGEDEAEGQWRLRVVAFFDNDEMQEYAEEALAGRTVGVNPSPRFRSSSDRRLAVDAGGAPKG